MGRAERLVESYLVERIRAHGGETRKLTWVGRSGAPDRIALFPNGVVWFIECKAKAGKLSAQQKAEQEMLNRLGFLAVAVYSREEVDALFAS